MRTWVATVALLGAAVSARAESVDAHGTVSVANLRPLPLPFPSKGDFIAQVEWTGEGVALIGGGATCRLAGPGVLTAASDCRVWAGGGSARTEVTCPASGIRATRTDSELAIQARGCTARWKNVPLTADLDITVSKPSAPEVPVSAVPSRCDSVACVWSTTVSAKSHAWVPGPRIPRGVVATVRADGEWTVIRRSGPAGNGVKADRPSFVAPGLTEGQLVSVEHRDGEPAITRGYQGPLTVVGPATLAFNVNDEVTPKSTKYSGFADNDGAVEVTVSYAP